MSITKQAKRLMKLLPEWAWNYTQRQPIATYNPARSEEGREEVEHPVYTVFDYNSTYFEERKLLNEAACKPYRENGRVTWINIDGLNKKEVEKLCAHYEVHPLIVDDILSVGQRPKMDEIGNIIYCLLPMIYFNDSTGAVETEQVSIVLGNGFLLSFQEDASRDVFDPVRDRLRSSNARLREGTADYLCYNLIDVIVDSYFGIIDKINDRIEQLEDLILLNKNIDYFSSISIMRREVMLLRRSIGPVRELINGFLRSDNKLLDDKHDKFYKDVYDHIIQANEYVEAHREMLMNLQDLYMNRVNLRMNEVMKIFTMVALLLAPATVIGGIFGMNFDVIPFTHQKMGFYISVSLMFVIPIFMLIYFKRKGWF